GLAGILMGSKGGRKLAGNALTYGGLAVVGALAYKAYRDYQAGKAVPPAGQAAGQASQGQNSGVPLLPPPADTPFNPATEEGQQALGRSLLRAMIAAAKADGHVDGQEQAAIFGQMDRLNLDADDKAFVIDELRKPLDVDAVASAARTPEEAAEIYAASLLAIDVDNPAERGYLAMLAARLKLDEGLVAHLHATIEEATVPARA
ncbi:MAG TPA: tellurite resistance TerB family protein, partial [Xanthobacteraceae bacterium]|nr:tellurite resistance TerB family protein [Xanthobacteraceae bacterium]